MRKSRNVANHVWLETDNRVIIDITGDQFRHDPIFHRYNQPVYVGEEDAFHKLFANRTLQESFDFRTSDAEGKKRMMDLYCIISEY